MRLLNLLLAAGPALAYNIASGAGIPAQPACSLYTIYYTDSVDLVSATSTFFSSMNSCTATSSSVATSSTIAAVDPCAYSSDNSVLKNPGFECINLGHFGWTLVAGTTAKNPLLITGGSIAAHGGSSFLQFKADNTGRYYNGVKQTLGNVAGVATVSLWAQAVAGFDNTRCTLFAANNNAMGESVNLFAPTTPSNLLPVVGYWAKYTGSFTISAGASFEILIQGCLNSASLYIDDITFTM